MILNTKQLEELESIHDSATDFEDDASNSEGDNIDDNTDSALAWRRGMLEKASANVKKALKKPIDPEEAHALGSLVFDRKAKRFARVKDVSDTSLSILYLSGKEGEIARSQVDDKMVSTGEFLNIPDQKESAASKGKKKSPAKSTKLKTRTRRKKEEIAVQDMKAVKSLMENQNPASETKKTGARTKLVRKTTTLKSVTKSKAQKQPVKTKTTPVKSTTEVKTTPKKRPARPVKHTVTKTNQKTIKRSSAATYISYSAISDPIADPNGYIKQYYQLMNNKELAVVTGLSEHTIRRKLGEWGLKRINKLK